MVKKNKPSDYKSIVNFDETGEIGEFGETDNTDESHDESPDESLGSPGKSNTGKSSLRKSKLSRANLIDNNKRNIDILQELALIRKSGDIDKALGSRRNLKSDELISLEDNDNRSSVRSLDDIIDELDIKDLFVKEPSATINKLSVTTSKASVSVSKSSASVSKSLITGNKPYKKSIPKSNWLDLDDEDKTSDNIVTSTQDNISDSNTIKASEDNNDKVINVAIEDINLNAGHRERLRKRLLKHTDSLYDYEILELLLTYIIKRKDVKTVAKRILNEIGGDLAKFKELDLVRLNSIEGVGDGVSAFMFLLQEFNRRISVEQIRTDKSKNLDLFDEPTKVVNTLRQAIGNFNVESAYIALYDKNRELLEFERLDIGSSYEVKLDFKRIVHRCMDSRVKFVILIHTHIGINDIKPSFADKEITRNLEYLLHSIDVTLYDHYIVTEGGLFSFRSNRLIRF